VPSTVCDTGKLETSISVLLNATVPSTVCDNGKLSTETVPSTTCDAGGVILKSPVT
jgi:hypothetical protein